MNSQNQVPLPRVLPEICLLPGVTGASPGYRRLYTLALDGRFRTEVVNGRYFVERAVLPQIARLLGMIPTD